MQLPPTALVPARVLVRSVVLLAAIVTLGCSSQGTCPAYPAAAARPLLWRVAGPSGMLVIQATHQGLDGTAISKEAWGELARADTYVTEANEADDQTPFDWQRATHGSGPSLRAKIGRRAFDRLAFYLGVSADQLVGLKPWAAFVLLGREAAPPAGRPMTFALLDRVTSLGLPTRFLDTWDEQLAYLDMAITPAKLRAAIDDYDHLACQMAYRIDAFRAGDEAVFAAEGSTRGDPATLRTERWFRSLSAIISSGRHAFVAVGIGHLVGPHGLLHQLAASGFRVERL